ncbi:MAG: hypothetical protein R3301_10515, partial [Saprospiraceae bacterium]|nr:hypothetical protein [Saprospiraceae bacterium]
MYQVILIWLSVLLASTSGVVPRASYIVTIAPAQLDAFLATAQQHDHGHTLTLIYQTLDLYRLEMRSTDGA